jgi:antitoxin CptB
MTDGLDARRKRALFRSLRRGTKESDLVIGGFAKAHVARLSAEQLGRFEALLDCPDPDLLAWIVGRHKAPAERECDVLELMREYERLIRRS